LMRNKMRELIREGRPTIGTRISTTWPAVVELIGQTGLFDYFEFLGEYAPWSLYDLENLARAGELYGLASMIKVDAKPRTYIAAKALQSGIQNFLFADIRTPEDAEESVKAVRCEPEGTMGVGNFRVGGYLFTRCSFADYRRSCQDAVIALMIEKRSAVEHLEEILSVEGVDMVQFGPWDYALSLGLSGERGTAWGLDDPKVKKAELKTIKTALKMDKRPRVEIGDPRDIEKYIELGVKDFNLGTDLRILYNFWKEKGEELKRILHKTL
jgi:2-keto-3-deoxy-L-rhamnonate aldolase RhmA